MTQLTTKQVLLYEAIQRLNDFCQHNQSHYQQVKGFSEAQQSLNNAWQKLHQALEDGESSNKVKQLLKEADNCRKTFWELTSEDDVRWHELEAHACTVHDFNNPQRTALKGKVTHYQTKLPVAEVVVRISEYTPDYKENRFSDFLTTGDDGCYCFKGIPHGKMMLSFEYQGDTDPTIMRWLSCGEVFEFDVEVGYVY